MLREEDIGVELGERLYIACPFHCIAQKTGGWRDYSRDNKYITTRDFRPPPRSR